MRYTAILLIVCCATFYYWIGEQEYASGGLLALVSVALWLIGGFGLGLGWLGCLLLQIGLFVGLTCWNLWRRPRQ